MPRVQGDALVAGGCPDPGRPEGSRLRTALANLLLVGLSLALSFGLAEITLRIFPSLLPQETRLRLHWHALGTLERKAGDGMIVADDELGYLYRSHYRGRLVRQDLAFDIVTDAQGFRNPDPWPPTADVVVVGDSMAFGYGVTREEAWPARVEQALDGPRVLNLGLIGAAPQQYTGILRRFGLPAQPKLMIYSLFPGNDLTDARTFADWEVAGKPVPFPLWKSGERGPAVRGSFEWVVQRLLHKSYVVTFAREAVRTARSPFSNQTLTLPDGDRIELAPTVYGHAAALAAAGEPDFFLVVSTIAEAREACLKHGIEFVVLLMPTKERIYLPLLGEPIPELFQPFKTEFERRGIPYIDPTEAMRAEAEAGRKLYFTIDGHLNAAGHAVLAGTVMRHLRTEGVSTKGATKS